jgi:hypothetical protein
MVLPDFFCTATSTRCRKDEKFCFFFGREISSTHVLKTEGREKSSTLIFVECSAAVCALPTTPNTILMVIRVTLNLILWGVSRVVSWCQCDRPACESPHFAFLGLNDPLPPPLFLAKELGGRLSLLKQRDPIHNTQPLS